MLVQSWSCSLLLWVGVNLILLNTIAESKKKVLCPSMLKKLLGDGKSCQKVKCAALIKEDSCPEDSTLTPGITSCGCCPACLKSSVAVKEGEPCNELTYGENCKDGACLVVKKECGPGLICNEETSRCVKVDEQKPGLTCADKLALYEDGRLHWKPNCNPDGSYAPRQCKGEIDKSSSMCFCTNPQGKRIFGRRNWNANSDKEMNCACSLHIYQLREEKGLLSTLHCTYDGSYEELQCDTDSGLCYCVNSVTGALTGAVLPESFWKDLPCYNKTIMGDQYYRQCDSYWAATERINREAKLHGLDLEKYPKYYCDYDGSFSKFQDHTGSEECVYRNGLRIESYYRTGSGAGTVPMDCNCARARSDFEYEGLQYSSAYKCETEGRAVGNYATAQLDGSAGVCVDSDGFRYGQFQNVPPSHLCCLLDKPDCAAEQMQDCASPTNPTGYKRCIDIVS